MHACGLARFHRRNAPPAGTQGRSHLRPVDPRRRRTRRAAAVPGGAARPGPGDQPAPLGAALPTAGPVEGLTAVAAPALSLQVSARVVAPQVVVDQTDRD